jgi:hypothetical protein
LEAKLTEDEFNVLNHGIWPPFPSSGRQREFHEKFDAILRTSLPFRESVSKQYP